MVKQELIHVGIEVTPEQLPTAMQELGRLVGDKVIESVFQPYNLSDVSTNEGLNRSYDPELIEWIGEPDDKAPVITPKSIGAFTARTRPDAGVGVGIGNRIVLAGRTNAKLRQYLYYDYKTSRDAIGIRADTYFDLLKKLGLQTNGSFFLELPEIKIKDVSVLRLRIMKNLGDSLIINSPE